MLQQRSTLQQAMPNNAGAAAHLQHHAGEQVVQHADGVLALVVGGDGHIHTLRRGTGVQVQGQALHAEWSCSRAVRVGLPAALQLRQVRYALS